MRIRRFCRTIAHLSKRHLGFSDNMTTVLALDKGRSSTGLKAICRWAAAYQLADNQQWKWRYIESARNVADWGSRRLAPLKAGAQTSALRPPPGLEHIVPYKTRSSEWPRVEKPAAAVPPPRPTAPCVATAVSLPSSFPSCSSSAPPARLRHPVRPIRNSTRSRACLELFSGCESLTLALRSAGLSCFEGVELKKGEHFDLCRPELQALVLQLIREGFLYYVHLGTPCTIWSRARRGIRNWARAEQKERIGLQLALFFARVIEC